MTRSQANNPQSNTPPRTFRIVGGRATSTTPPAIAPAARTVPPAPVTERRAAQEQDVRELAYHKWVAAGSPPGDGVTFWLEAERELRGK